MFVKNKSFGLIGSVFLVLLMSFDVNATVLNGGFDDGVDNWNDDSSTGSFIVRDGRGILETGAGSALPFSAIAIQGDDGSFSFSSPLRIAQDVIKLSVDLSFERIGVDSGEDTTASSFTDNLSITFLDETDPTLDLVFTPETDFTPSVDLLTFLFDVSGVAGRTGALAFELNDENDGFDTRVVFDNVSFVSNVPVPAAVWLFGSALLGLVGSNVSRRNIC